MEINIYEDFATQTVKILFFDMTVRPKRIFNLYTGDVLEVNEGEMIPDSFAMKVPSHMVDSLFKSLAEHLSERGVKTKNDSLIEGQLDATKYHLEDLRKLLKIK